MRLKFFSLALVLSFPFWLGVNLLEKNLKDFFFWQEATKNSRVFTAQIALGEKTDEQLIKKEIADPQLNATSALSIFIDNNGKEKVLFQKEPALKLPIASLTKLMTALVVLENYDLEKKITISKNSINQEEEFGRLEAGKTFKVEYLLYPLLIESSNDAAFSLANDYDGMTEETFVGIMNQAAERLGLSDTYFINLTGLDEKEQANYSTASDLEKLTRELLKNQFIWEILSSPKFDIYGPELTNTNKLLEEEITWRSRITGGKTGYTQKAGGCIMLALRAPKNRGVTINIILGTAGPEERFEEMKKLVAWTNKAYNW